MIFPKLDRRWLCRVIAAACMAVPNFGVGAGFGQLEFSPVKIPETDAEKRSILATDQVTVDGRCHTIGFHTLLRSGDARFGEMAFGTLIDANREPIPGKDGSPLVAATNDFSSLINLGPDALYMVSHFEYRPGAIYITQLKQDHDTGLLSALKTRPIDLSPVDGGWVHCAGSVTPWNTHLGSEEYEPDAKLIQADNKRCGNDRACRKQQAYLRMADYFPGADITAINPYAYGWPIEIEVKGFDQVSVRKHYAMGRISLELAYVLPDRRTVYLSDDGSGVGFYMFIADQDGVLDSGTLYAAEWQHVGKGDDGRPLNQATLAWHNLGHATSSHIKKLLDDGITFDRIFTTTEPADGVCPMGFRSVNHGHGVGHPYTGQECLKLKPGMAQAASRLETRRYAAMLGATTEFRKLEGITYDTDRHRLYLAMSQITYGMEDYAKNGVTDDTYDIGGPNHIRLRYNRCGTVYGLALAKEQKDSCDTSINSQHVAKDMDDLLSGVMTQAWDARSKLPAYPRNGPFAPNRCDLSGIANPDNITYIPGYDTLIISEDSAKGHQNDMIWSFNLTSKELIRIQTSPYGAENTSPYFYPNINGFAYLMSVVQHPYGATDKDKYRKGSKTDRAYTGYIGPFPAMDGARSSSATNPQPR